MELSEINFTQLEDKIMIRISRARLVRTHVRGAVHGGIFLASIIGFVFVVRYGSSQAYNSGFYEYASLFISDTSYAFSHLKSMFLSLAESIPLLDISFAMTIALICINSFKKSLSSLFKLNNINKNSKYSHA